MIFEKKKPIFQHVCKKLEYATGTKQEEFDSPWDRLAAEIVIGAIHDWKHLIKSKAWLDNAPHLHHHVIISFDEIRSFFRSSYCDFLMQNFSMTPEGVLMMLEEELREAMEKGNRRDGSK